MVKSRKSNFRKNRNKKGRKTNRTKARKINASTPFETCSEQLSPFGGLLALIKFLDLMLLFIGFNLGRLNRRIFFVQFLDLVY